MITRGAEALTKNTLDEYMQLGDVTVDIFGNSKAKNTYSGLGHSHPDWSGSVEYSVEWSDNKLTHPDWDGSQGVSSGNPSHPDWDGSTKYSVEWSDNKQTHSDWDGTLGPSSRATGKAAGINPTTTHPDWSGSIPKQETRRQYTVAAFPVKAVITTKNGKITKVDPYFTTETLTLVGGSVVKDTGKKTSNMQGSLNISVPGTKASVGGALDESSVSTGVGAGFNVSPVNVDIPMSAGDGYFI